MTEIPVTFATTLFWLSLVNVLRLTLAKWTTIYWRDLKNPSLDAAFFWAIIGLALSLPIVAFPGILASWILLLVTLMEYPQLGFPIYIGEPCFLFFGPCWDLLRPGRKFLPSLFPGFTLAAKTESYLNVRASDGSRELRLKLTVKVGNGWGNYQLEHLKERTANLVSRAQREGSKLLTAEDDDGRVLTNPVILQKLNSLPLPSYETCFEELK